jgi:hypothetical protein
MAALSTSRLYRREWFLYSKGNIALTDVFQVRTVALVLHPARETSRCRPSHAVSRPSQHPRLVADYAPVSA